MSVVSIRAALEVALDAITPALETAWENAAFKPTTGTPYQQVNMMFAPPDNATFGSAHRALGIMQVKLMYPLQVGTRTAALRAELIRTTFARGNSYVKDGVTVIIEKTPEVSPGAVEGDRWAVPVKVRFFSNIS